MKPVTLKIFGNVNDVIEGAVLPTKLRSVNEANFRFALGAATFSDPSSLGEALLIDGVTHVSWVDGKKLHHKSHTQALSPFLVGIDNKQPEGLFLHQSSPISLEKLYGKLATTYPMGFAFAASFLMKNFKGTYIKKAPIYGEKIMEQPEAYLSYSEDYSEKPLFLFGVVIPSNAKESYPEEVLSRAFYTNPEEVPSSSFDNHTHAALADKLVTAADSKLFLQSLKELKVEGVCHTLTESVIEKGSFLLFPLEKIINQ